MVKNNRIQFWRIVFTYLIAFYHLGTVYGDNKSWYIAVEFFFLVSGWLLADKFERLKQGNELSQYTSGQYVWNKVRSFFPHCLFSFLVAFAITGIYNGYTLHQYAEQLVSHLPEIFLLHSVGLNLTSSFWFNSPVWYISTMLIISFFLWFALRRDEDKTVHFWIPLAVLLIYPYLYRTYGSLTEHYQVTDGIMNSALLRGAAAMGLGVLARHLRDKVRKDWLGAVISDVALIAGGIILPMFWYRSSMDFLFTALLFVGVTYGFACGRNLLFNNSLVEKWAAITPAIYLNHKVFRNVCKVLWPVRSWKVDLAFGVFVTGYSVITWLVFFYLWGRWREKQELSAGKDAEI